MQHQHVAPAKTRKHRVELSFVDAFIRTAVNQHGVPAAGLDLNDRAAAARGRVHHDAGYVHAVPREKLKEEITVGAPRPA